MALRDDLLPVFEGARQLIQDFGLRQHRVWIRLGTWSAGEIHLGSLVNADTELLPRPKCKPLGPSRLEVSKITPNHTTGGWEPDEILPAVVAGQDFYFIVRGPDGSDVAFQLTDVDSTRNFTYTLTLDKLPRALPDF